MPLTLRSEKQAPLTVEELDQNFKELSDRIERLEKGNFPIETLDKIRHEGQEIVFMSSQGRELGRCPLPVPALQGRGVWQKEAAYCPGDLVDYEKSLFLCRHHHIAQEAPPLEGKNWTLLCCLASDKDKERLLQEDIPEGANAPGSFPNIKELPLYERETLPKPSLGKVGILLAPREKPKLIFSTGQNWEPVALEKTN